MSRNLAPPSSPRKRVRRNNEADADQMRARFVEAAFELFAQGGLKAVSIRSVAARVGVSPMVTYWYFADKTELMSGLVLAVLHDLSVYSNGAMTRARSARGRLRALIGSTLQYWEDNPDRYSLVYGFTEIGHSREGKSKLAQVPMYARIVDAGVQATADFALELGLPDTNVRLANDLRVAMGLGYLLGTLVATRYPWSEANLLREAYVQRSLDAVEMCLRHGCASAPAPESPAPRARVRRKAQA